MGNASDPFTYLVQFRDGDGKRRADHVYAYSAQEAADKIRLDCPGCYVQRVALCLQDWK